MALRKLYPVIEKPIAGLGLVNPPPIRVEFDGFDGSLAHLFSCVRDRKINLEGVPLLPICEAYFRYLMSGPETNLDEGAAALAALAYLLERKAWLLLPFKDSSEILEDEILALRETSIHEYFETVVFLRNGFEERSRLYFRSPHQGPHPYELPYQLDDLDVNALAEALQRVLTTLEKPVIEDITRAGRSLVTEIRDLLLRISKEWQEFENLLQADSNREDAVYVFLGLLELIRLGQVRSRTTEGMIEFSQV